MSHPKKALAIAAVSVLAVCVCGYVLLWNPSKAPNRDIQGSTPPEKGSDGVSSTDITTTSVWLGGDLQLTEGMADMLDKPIDELMDLEWSKWPVRALLRDADLVGQAIKEIAVDGEAGDWEPQIGELRSTIKTMLLAYGSNNHSAYFDYLRDSGESVVEETVAALRKIMVTELQVQEGELETDSWKLLSQFSKLAKLGIHWDGLVVQGSRIRLYSTRTATLPPLGRNFQRLRGQIVVYHHVATPPVELGTVIASRGSAIIADVTVFISHSDELGGVVRPYVIRFWYDPINGSWRPKEMCGFSRQNEGPAVQLIF